MSALSVKMSRPFAIRRLATASREITRYPSAIAGLAIIGLLLAVAIYAVVAIPYDEAVRLWRGGEEIWGGTPKLAHPAWTNWFRREKLPETLMLDTTLGDVPKQVTPLKNGMSDVQISFAFDYPYAAFPQDISVVLTANSPGKPSHFAMEWHTPDGRTIRMGEFSVQGTETYRIAQDTRLQKRLKGQAPEQGLFMPPASSANLVADGQARAVPGRYDLLVTALTFDPAAQVDARFVLYGQVYGVAGTDHRRRDLSVALLWGTPIALAFGLLAALGTTVLTMVIAAIGSWFGGWVDNLIQRITEVNLILPFLPILIMIGTLYSRSIWLMLGAAILLSIFGGQIKTYRAIFLQVKESPYIEAAKAYGAGNRRIILRYLLPRIVPVLVPQLVSIIPTFVFLEASLAVLGLGDPVLPTWGKVIDDARANGAVFQGQYYWVLEPSLLLMIGGLAFAMVGFALDRVFNPRLRGV